MFVKPLILAALSFAAMSLAASSFAAPPSSAAPPKPCYSPGMPAPPITRQTVVMIDLTTARDAAVIADFRRAVALAASDLGQRVSVVSFAGIGNGEHLAERPPLVIEAPITDDKARQELSIRSLRQSQKCVADEGQAAPGRVLAMVDAELARLDPNGHRQSEIVQALHETLGRMATPKMSTRLLAYSDGLEFGRHGLNFYGADKRPRTVKPTAEWAKLPSPFADPPVADMGPVRVLWWGLLAEEYTLGRRPDNHYSAATLTALRGFWTGLLLDHWGVKDVQLGQTVMNADLNFAPNTVAAQTQRRVHMAGIAGVAATVGTPGLVARSGQK